MRNPLVYIKNHPVKFLLWLLATLAVIVFAFLWWVGHELFYSPVCDAWRSGMTKEEKIMMALEIANAGRELTFEIVSPESHTTYLGNGRQVPYRDASTILSKYPDCCRLVEQGFYDSNPQAADQAGDKVSDSDEGTVVLRYTGRYVGSDDEIHKAKVFWHADLNHCKK